MMESVVTFVVAGSSIMTLLSVAFLIRFYYSYQQKNK